MNHENRPEMIEWEFAVGCNLHCTCCEPSCEEGLSDELVTAESLLIVDDIIKLKPSWLSLSGDVPLLQKGWDTVTKKLTDNDIKVSMITNGTEIDESIAARMVKSGISIVSVNLDGTKDIHDKIRGEGVWDKAERAFSVLKDQNIQLGSNTTVTKENIGILEELRDELIRMGVKKWQIQPELPEGNQKSPTALSYQDIEYLIGFTFEENKRGKIDILLDDSIGCYSWDELNSNMRSG
jgi:MoaA/NifB/PqqE/SkfB family radical SAM enzyme